MKNQLFGSLGTQSGLYLRILRCVLAAASAAVMASASSHSSSSFIFRYLILAMGVLFMWSLALCCMDLHSLMLTSKIMHSRVSLLRLILFGDWAISAMCIGVASAAFGVVDYQHTFGICSTYWSSPCFLYTLSVMLAFVASLLGITTHVVFRIFVSSFRS